jgi:hypothetical protein
MPKTVGLLAIDPGWRGLAITLYLPMFNMTSTRLFQLNIDAKKGYTRPANTIPLLVNAIKEQLLKEDHSLLFVDKIIIESQFRQNMQVLSYLILCVFQTLLPDVKIEMISALKCKRMFGVPLGSSHYENKQRMLRYVLDHKHELIGGKTVTNHDTADSVILLNTYLKEKPRRLETSIENVFTMVEGTEVECPKCFSKGHVRVVKRPGKNCGKYFMTCSQYKDDNKCGFKFLGYDEPEITEIDGVQYIDEWRVFGQDSQPVGTKRKAPPAKTTKAPPAKVKPGALKVSQVVQPIKAVASVTKEEVLKMMVDMVKTITAHFDDRFAEITGNGIPDEDSGVENSQEAPEEVE